MNQATKISLVHQLLIVLFVGCLFFSALGSTRLWDQDEAYFAGSAAEMWRAGDWVVPRFNGEVFSHKPPWMFWMMMLGYGLFGETDFAARFFAAVFGVATALATYHFAREWFNRRVALWSGLAMGSMLMFMVVSRAASPDAYLTFFSMLGIGWLVRPPKPTDEPEPDAAHYDPKLRVTDSKLRWCLAYLAMGFAVLVKGPIGFLFPMAVVGLYLMLSQPGPAMAAEATRTQKFVASLRWLNPVNFWKCLWAMAPLRGVLLALLVASPWYIAVTLRTDGEFLAEFIGTHNLGRFSGAMDGHSGGPLYYFTTALIGTFPWSILLVPTLLIFRHTMRQEKPQAARGTSLVLAWVSVYFIIFSLAATKLPSYVLPAYPAIAMAVGLCVAGLIDNRHLVSRWWPRVAFGVWMTIGAGVCLGFPIVASLTRHKTSLLESFKLSGELNTLLWQLWPLGLIPLLAGVFCLWLWERDRRPEAMRAMTISCGAILAAMLIYAPTQVNRLQYSPQLVETAKRAGTDAEFGQCGYFRPSLVHYGKRPVQQLGTENIYSFLANGNRAVFIRGDMLEKVEAESGVKLEVLGSQPRFPERGTIYVVKLPDGAAAEIAAKSGVRR